ncbi:hypothetical protein [Sphaerotilus uruguayifluvii]|uniref:Membrane protein n=1 Tax=Sphaerotilus uruguayifluvii TaxID=2735897 RepID=A0ABX2FZ36_9BURK|nr:hypothetical protein [Leptothrix sp. C29]NRT54458.1 putative membrane protein [Leptothrix sp. C29]
MELDLVLAAVAVAVALWLRPWRVVGPAGPPWVWLGWCAVMPVLWGTDRYVASTVVQPLSGAVLLMMMAGWPLAVLAMVPVALATWAMAGLEGAEALHRLVWLGDMPATIALGLGAAVRRWLPHQLFVYILGRGFVATALSCVLSGALSMALHGATPGLDPDEQMIGRWLAAWGDAFLVGMVVAIFVAFRPEWLATYSDRLYLRPPESGGPPDRDDGPGAE